MTGEQAAAVAHPTGRPARVLAGAGTGKTRVIVARFLRLVSQNTDPERILALTFSRAAAAQMRTEVVRQLAAGRRLWISTFHSFCLRIVETELARPLRLLYAAEAKALLTGLAGNVRLAEEAHAFIGQAKDQLLTPADVAAYATARDDVRLQQLADLYARFQAELTAQGAAEFGDFIYQAVALLAGDPAVAARWQARFDHILVDEFQDTNLAQFRVLQMLMRPHGNLMVVGDDDQAIYRFRGASDRFMRDFHIHIKDAVDYPVVENFRCPAPVLAVANQLIQGNAPERVPKALYTTTKRDGFSPVAHWEARTEREEAEAVAAEIERRIKAGRHHAGDFAILLRSVRRCGGEFARALRERSIPYRLVGEAYPHPVIGQTMALLRLTRSINRADLLTVLAAKSSPAEVFAYVRGGDRSVPAPINEWLTAVTNRPVAEQVYEALRFLGHLKLPLQPTADDLERISAVRRLQEAATGSLDELLIDTGEPAPGAAADAVTIMTIHAAKGLQFPVVFVGALAEGLFPVAVDAAPVYYLAEAIRDWADSGQCNEMTGTQRLAQHIREERRLAYVALTRAEEELILTRALTYDGEPVQPSRFLAEMGAPPHVAVSGRTGDVAGAARAYLVEAAAGIRRTDAARVSAAVTVLKAEPGALALRRQADPQPFGGAESLTLSASAIETYRVCPRKYYYAYVLGLPDQDNVYTAFGSALHAALERFNQARMAGPLPEWGALESFFAAALQPDAFAGMTQFRQLHERGRIFLKRYYDWMATDPREVVSTEGAFAFDYVDGKGRTHRIRGRYDLIERDRTGREEIIDYKSGTRQSTGVNKRPTGKSDNDPQRKLQLGLYYLARHSGQAVPGARVSYIFLRHDKDKPPLTWLDGFDPGEQYIACEHTPETLAGIRTLIDGVIDAILANNFDRNADEWKCSFCPFQDACEVSRRAYY